MYRDILVHVDGSPEGLRRLRFSAELARRTDANLAGLHVRPPADIWPVAPRYVGEAVEQRMEALASDSERAELAFAAEAAGLRNSWCSTEGDIADGICKRAVCADLVIVGQYEWQAPSEMHPLPIAHSVVLKCGRPVIIVPGDIEKLSLDKIAVVWRGSREDVRAVHDALPLLISAETVDVLVDSGAVAATRDRAVALVDHIRHHGGPEPRVVEARDPAKPQRGADFTSGDHDLLVIGGSSHPTWLEFIFGGVTPSVLMESKVPILASY
jgi:nucleotide-binding universal stress UspA family protein